MKKSLVFLMAFVVCMGVATAQAELVSHYTFDNTADNAVSGAPNGTLVNGPTYVAGYSGSALQFDGVNDYVDTTTSGFPNGGSGLAAGTVDFWMKTTNTSSKQTIIGACNPDITQAFDIDTIVGGGLELFLRASDGAFLAGTASIASAFDGGWHQVAVTWNATTGDVGSGSVEMYLDGVKKDVSLYNNDITSASTWSAWENSMRIGINGRGTPNWDPYSGSLDEIRISGVPEPSSIMLIVGGIIGLLAYAWRRRK